MAIDWSGSAAQGQKMMAAEEIPAHQLEGIEARSAWCQCRGVRGGSAQPFADGVRTPIHANVGEHSIVTR